MALRFLWPESQTEVVALAASTGPSFMDSADDVLFPAASRVAQDVGTNQEATVESIRLRLGSAEELEKLALLSELLLLNDPAALDLLFEKITQDPDALGSEVIWGLLYELDDPRVFELARNQFERALAEGLSGRRFTTGYLKLIASHGGEEGSRMLLTQLHSEGSVRAGEAAGAIGFVKDRSHADAFLEMVASPDGRNQGLIGRALGHWRDPYVEDVLFELARSSDTNRFFRQSILEGMGSSARSSADMDDVYLHYWLAEGDKDWVGSAFSGLDALQANRSLDSGQRFDRTTAVLEDVLATGNWSYGVNFLMSYSEYRTPTIKASLQTLLSGLHEPSQVAQVKAALLRFP